MQGDSAMQVFRSKQGCEKCNRPCIKGENGKCRIAKVRIALDCSFRDAWQILTNCNFDQPKSQPEFSDLNLKQKFQDWKAQGEPMPLQFEI